MKFLLNSYYNIVIKGNLKRANDICLEYKLKTVTKGWMIPYYKTAHRVVERFLSTKQAKRVYKHNKSRKDVMLAAGAFQIAQSLKSDFDDLKTYKLKIDYKLMSKTVTEYAAHCANYVDKNKPKFKRELKRIMRDLEDQLITKLMRPW